MKVGHLYYIHHPVLDRHFIIGNKREDVLLESNIKQLERKQKLYNLLKTQYDAELSELMHYAELLSKVHNALIRSYYHTLLNDGLKHIQYISGMMSNIEGASRSQGLTKKGIEKSISEEKESRKLLLNCIEIADDPEVKSLLKSIIVDEDHHIKILEHISELVESYSS